MLENVGPQMQRMMMLQPPRTILKLKTRSPPSRHPSPDSMASWGGSSQLCAYPPAQPATSVHELLSRSSPSTSAGPGMELTCAGVGSNERKA